MKIGFDGKRAANNLTGLGNYSRSLIEHLAKSFKEHSFLVFTPKVKQAKQIDQFLEIDNISLKLPQQKSLLWRSFGIKKDLIDNNVEIFHGLSHEIPFGIHKTKIKSVVTIHDLIFLRFPEYYKFIDRKLYTLKSKYACINSNKIIAISEKTKADVVDFYQISPDKIEVVYQSCDDNFKKPFSQERLNKIKLNYHLPEKYLLNVGTIETRKNLALIVSALKNIDPNYKLVAIGKQTSYFDVVKNEIEKNNLSDRVIFLKDIPFADLPGIYQNAKIFIYPSLYEGFGIPIIEALYSGIPVIAATGSCLEEAGGPNSLYINPYNAEELTTAIIKVINSENLAANMAKEGLEFVKKFDNNLINKQLIKIYQNLIQTP